MILEKIARLLYPHGTVRSVLRGPLRGMRFVVVPGMGATYALGYDCWHHRFLQKRINPGMVVYDVGGNRGQMALFFSRAVSPSGSVFSFEPVPANAAIMKRNLGLNSLSNAHLLEIALGACNGMRPFVFDADLHTNGTFADFHVKLPGHKPSLEVSCRKMDDLVRDGLPKPGLLKIDVEGGAGEVIEGAAETIGRCLPPIYFEVHATTEQCPEFLALKRLKEEWKYRITEVSSGTVIDPRPMWGGAVWCEAHDI